MGQKSKEIWEQTFACSQDWDAMPGDARTRYCGQCDRHLVNLSTMTQDEAIAWMRSHDEDFCGVLEIVDDRLIFAPPKLPPAPSRLAALAFPMLLACQEPSVAVSQPAVANSESADTTPMAPKDPGAAQAPYTLEDDGSCDGLEEADAAKLSEQDKKQRKALAMAEIAVDLGLIRACSDRVTLVCPKEVKPVGEDPDAPFASNVREGRSIEDLNMRRQRRRMGKIRARPELEIERAEGPKDF